MVKCYLEHMPGWSLHFVIRGLGTDTHSNTSRKRGFIMDILVAWDGKPSRMRQLHGLPTLVATWSGSRASAGSMRMPPFLQLQVDPSVDSQNSLLRASSFRGLFWLFWCPLLYVLQFSLSTTSLPYDSLLTFPKRAISWFLLIFLGGQIAGQL